MAKFEFRLQSVIDVREKQEQMKQRDLAEIMRERAEEEERLARMQSIKMEFVREVSVRSRGSIIDLLQDQAYLTSVNNQISSQEETIQEVGTREQSKRDELITTMKNRKMLEKIREYRLEEHEKSELKKDQHMMDSIASRSYWKNDHQ